MQVGEVFPLFPTFGQFCQYARVAPHVLPHDFCGSMEGYYQILWNDTFALTSKIANPSLPYAQIMFHIHNTVLKYAYPMFGGPVVVMQESVYPKLPEEAKIALQQEGVMAAWRNLPNSRNEIYNYLAAAADKLNSFLAGYVMPTPERKTLKEIPPYTTQSPTAAQYLSSSTFLPLEKVPEIVNPIVSANISAIDIGFPRLPRLEETVQPAGVLP